LGTAENVARIIPVEYSPVITRTPRTPIASCATPTPINVVSSGLKVSLSWRLIVDQRFALISAGMIAKTIVAPTPASSV
jgi:hypothetical protein